MWAVLLLYVSSLLMSLLLINQRVNESVSAGCVGRKYRRIICPLLLHGHGNGLDHGMACGPLRAGWRVLLEIKSEARRSRKSGLKRCFVLLFKGLMCNGCTPASQLCWFAFLLLETIFHLHIKQPYVLSVWRTEHVLKLQSKRRLVKVTVWYL